MSDLSPWERLRAAHLVEGDALQIARALILRTGTRTTKVSGN